MNVAVSAAEPAVAARAADDPAAAALDSPAAAAGGSTVSGSTAGQRTPASLQISYMLCEPDQKMGQLLRFLQVGRALYSCVELPRNCGWEFECLCIYDCLNMHNELDCCQ